MPESILDSTKKALGVGADYDVFDPDIIMHINTVFVVLHQLGVGPPEGYQITGDSESWEDYTQNLILLNSVKTYVYMKVRMVFDVPQTAHLVAALETQIKELEWRINVHREGVLWSI